MLNWKSWRKMVIEYPYVTDKNPNGNEGQKLYLKILDRIKQFSGVKRVCELGCGNGYFSGLLVKQEYEVVGIDSSQSGIEYASKNYGYAAKFIHSQISPNQIREWKLHDFDLVISIETIEHFYCPGDLLLVAKTLLRPGGG